MNTGMRLRHASPGKKIFIILMHLVMMTYVVLIIYPLFNMIMSSFKSTREIMKAPFSLPAGFDFSTYIDAYFCSMIFFVLKECNSILLYEVFIACYFHILKPFICLKSAKPRIKYAYLYSFAT